MPDSDKNLEILIKTTADLAGAKAAETQLEQDIAQARALGEAYDELESKLKSVRVALAENQGNDGAVTSPGISSIETQPRKTATPTPDAGARGGLDDDGRQAGADVESNRSGPAGWVKAGLEGLRLAGEALSNFFATAKNPTATPSADQIPGKTSIAATTAPALVNEPLPPSSNRTQDGVAWGSAQVTEQMPEADAQDGNEIFGRVAAGHAQTVQSSGEKIRVALEQNTQITVSLFNRTLELIDQQNRKLGEVDRKIAELGGQIKSLKNL